METYGGRLFTSTQSRAVKNSQGTANQQLQKEEQTLDKLRQSSQRRLGKEEEKLKKRLESLEKSKSRNIVKLDVTEDHVDNTSKSAASVAMRSRHRMSLDAGVGAPLVRSGMALQNQPDRRGSLPAEAASKSRFQGRERAFSLATGTKEMDQQKSVKFTGGKDRLALNSEESESIVPFIKITDNEDEPDDAGSKAAITTPRSSRESKKASPRKVSDEFDKMERQRSNSLFVGGASSGTLGSSPRARVSDMQALSVDSTRDSRPSATELSPRRSTIAGTSPSSISKAALDLKALTELKEILKDSRLYTTKKTRQLDMGPDSSSMRLQRKRMVQLEQLLASLKPGRKEPPRVELDPLEVLNCAYLRLSKDNIETLEQMVRDSGRDPGIHAHSDVTDFKLFDDKPAQTLSQQNSPGPSQGQGPGPGPSAHKFPAAKSFCL